MTGWLVPGNDVKGKQCNVIACLFFPVIASPSLEGRGNLGGGAFLEIASSQRQKGLSLRVSFLCHFGEPNS